MDFKLNRHCTPVWLIDWFRVQTVVVSAVVLVLTSNSYSTFFITEVFFCGIITVAFIFSILFLLYHISAQKTPLENVSHADTGLHIGFGVVMVVSGIFMLAGAIDSPGETQSITVQRFLAAFFGIENGLTFALVGGLLYRKHLQIQRQHSLPEEDLEWEDPLVQAEDSKKSFGSI